jgi:hypothetical protein
MKPRESSTKMMDLEDLAKQIFDELDPKLSDIIWKYNSYELGNSFIWVL